MSILSQEEIEEIKNRYVTDNPWMIVDLRRVIRSHEKLQNALVEKSKIIIGQATELNQLKAKLELCVETLQFYVESSMLDYTGEKARECLERIGNLK